MDRWVNFSLPKWGSRRKVGKWDTEIILGKKRSRDSVLPRSKKENLKKKEEVREWWPFKVMNEIFGAKLKVKIRVACCSDGICRPAEVHEPISYTTGREHTIKPPWREEAPWFCQHSPYSWYEQRAGGIYSLLQLWSLLNLKADLGVFWVSFQKRHSNWAIPQVQGNRIWEW